MENSLSLNLLTGHGSSSQCELIVAGCHRTLSATAERLSIACRPVLRVFRTWPPELSLRRLSAFQLLAGQFYECMNMASLYKLPCIFVVENNKWAIGMYHPRSASTCSAC